jgi:transposase
MEEAAELRALARVERDPRKRVRLLAIANVRAGMPIDEAARATGMGRATLYRWLAREQTGGPAALSDRPRSGRRRKLDAAQRAEVRAWVLAGPEVEKDGVVAWRGTTYGPWSSAASRSSWRCPAPTGCWTGCTSRLWCRGPATATPTRRPRPPSSKLPRARRAPRA